MTEAEYRDQLVRRTHEACPCKVCPEWRRAEKELCSSLCQCTTCRILHLAIDDLAKRSINWGGLEERDWE